MIGVYHKATLCKYRNDRRWDLCANKKTSCQPNSCANVLQKSCWYGVFITELYRATCSCFQHKDDDKLRQRVTRGWLPPCQSSFVNESLSDLGGMVFITKTIQYERSKDHHWDLVTNKNTEQVPYAHQHVLRMPQCEVCVYLRTKQCNICRDNR